MQCSAAHVFQKGRRKPTLEALLQQPACAVGGSTIQLEVGPQLHGFCSALWINPHWLALRHISHVLPGPALLGQVIKQNVSSGSVDI